MVTRHSLAASSIPGALLAHLLGAGEHPHPAAGHEILAARLENLQPSMLIAVAFAVQAASRGVCPPQPRPDRPSASRSPVEASNLRVYRERPSPTSGGRDHRARTGEGISPQISPISPGQSLKSQSGRQDSNLRPSAPKALEIGSPRATATTGFAGSKPLLSKAFTLPADGRLWRRVPSLEGDSLADSLARGVVRA